MPAAILPGERIVGARSITFRADFDGAAAVISNADMVALTTAGTAINTFLTTVRADAAAAEAAFANLGGIVECRAQAGTLQPTAIGWTAAGTAPSLTPVGGDAGTFATITVRLAHSVIL
jgi:hypothetical protein